MTPEQLKASILQYAIQGKLVPQDPSEGTGEELYQQIQEEKQRLIKEGKIKKGKPLAEIAEDEIPFDIPENWKWVRVQSVVTLNPKNELDDAADAGFIPMPLVSDGFRNRHSFEVKKWGDIKKGFSHFADGDIGVAKITPCFQNRKSVIFHNLPNGCGAGTTELTVSRAIGETMSREYLLWFFKTSYFIENGVKSFTGTAGQQRIHKDYLANCLLPLPPLAEQHRIVAKIEELLPYVDRYAAAYEKLEQLNAGFPKDMKKSVLQYAIQGKLVPQDPSEGTGEELYQQIQEEKQRLIKEGKIKKGKPLAEIAEDEIPFDIPESWKWVRLGSCSSYAQAKEKISPNEITKDIWVLDLEDIQKDTGRILAKIFACERKISGDKVKFRKGQILYSKLRPYLKKILVAPDDGICTPELIPFNAYGIDSNYVSYVLKSPYIDQVINAVTYGVKMPRVGTETMVNLLIPLPPLAEQHRIVAKLEEILPLCVKMARLKAVAGAPQNVIK